jgi:TolA-binding protein
MNKHIVDNYFVDEQPTLLVNSSSDEDGSFVQIQQVPTTNAQLQQAQGEVHHPSVHSVLEQLSEIDSDADDEQNIHELEHNNLLLQQQADNKTQEFVVPEQQVQTKEMSRELVPKPSQTSPTSTKQTNVQQSTTISNCVVASVLPYSSSVNVMVNAAVIACVSLILMALGEILSSYC